MPDLTSVEQLRAAATQLNECLVSHAVARVIERSIVAICPDHDEPALICGDCAYFDVWSEQLAALIVGLLNARLPLADWLQEVADDAAKFAEGFANSADEVATGRPLAVARTLT